MNEEAIEKVNKICRKIRARQYMQEHVRTFILDIWGILEDYKHDLKNVHETFDALFETLTNKFMQLRDKEQDK